VVAYNTFKAFNPGTAGRDCPPPSGGHGQASWWDDLKYPKMSGQTLECLTFTDATTGSHSPAYVWTFPNQNAILSAQGAPGSSFIDMENWWRARS
jgi:hypothetical protein